MAKNAVLLTFMFMLLACSGIGTRGRADGLVAAMDDYIAALRWGRYDSAVQYHLKKNGKRPQIDTSKLDAIRVTGDTIKQKTVNEALDEASVQLEIQYYNNAYGTLKKIIVNQTWWYHNKTKKWFISSDFPKF